MRHESLPSPMPNYSQFLTNLNLFEPTEVDQILNILDEDAKQKIDFRNMTYIPEISDKKHKISYTYLAPDIQSPPLLRTRQRNSANPSRMTSRSNSRATTPDRNLISRQMSNDSESSSKRSTQRITNTSQDTNTSLQVYAVESHHWLLALLSELWEMLV